MLRPGVRIENATRLPSPESHGSYAEPPAASPSEPGSGDSKGDAPPHRSSEDDDRAPPRRRGRPALSDVDAARRCRP